MEAEKSKSDAIVAYIDKVKAMEEAEKSKFDAIVAYIDKVKLLLSELEPHKEIEGNNGAKKLLSELQSRLQEKIEDVDILKKLLSNLQKEIESLSTQLKDKTPHQPLLLEEEKLHPILENFEVSYAKLNYQLRICLLYLSIFPENEVIKKRPIIYWWIANGLIKPKDGKTAEEEAEDIFEELLRKELILPCNIRQITTVRKCRIHPWIRHMLIKFAREANLFNFDSQGTLGDKIASSGHVCLLEGDDDNSKMQEKHQQSPTEDDVSNSERRDSKNREKLQRSPADPKSAEKEEKPQNLKTIFNVGKQYLFFGAGKQYLFSNILADSKKLVALQLGRWQGSPYHHIEIVGEDSFYLTLRTLKLLKYLSLRGISRITRLPPYILELTNLEILDLKECHNLEILPNEISKLVKLTHLDVSGCYLLERMPKELGKLTSLQSLKGFIIAESKRTFSRICNLKVLENLKRFSIIIRSDAEIEVGEFEKLEELKVLKRLKISWSLLPGNRKDKIMVEDFKFPMSLEKLVLEGLPWTSLPKWLKPSKFKGLKKLYIKGGHLNDLKSEPSDDEWKVEILRLLFMKSREINERAARQLFPYLRYKPEIIYRNGAQESKQTKES